MNKSGYTVIELLIVICIFSVIYLFGVVKTSHAFNYDPHLVEYEEKINLIEKIAEVYANKNENLFEEKKVVYIYVSDLIEKEYLKANQDGDIKDPRNVTKTLNDLKIKLAKEKDDVKVSIVKLDL